MLFLWLARVSKLAVFLLQLQGTMIRTHSDMSSGQLYRVLLPSVLIFFFYCSKIKSIGHGCRGVLNKLCIIVFFYPKKNMEEEDKNLINSDDLTTYTEKIKVKIIDSIDNRSKLDITETNPHWLEVNVDNYVFEELNDPSGIITDGIGAGGTLTMIVKIENENKNPKINEFYGITCLHVLFSPRRLYNPVGSNINAAVNNQQTNPGNQPDANADHKKINNHLYCISMGENYSELREALKVKYQCCMCPDMFHELSLFPLMSKDHLNKLPVYWRMSTNHVYPIGHVASVLYGNAKENYKLGMPVPEPGNIHAKTFRADLTAEFVAFSISSSVKASFNLVEGKTYEARDDIIRFDDDNEVGSSSFFIEDLNREQNKQDSIDGKYYTFNFRYHDGLKALSRCGLLYKPDKVYEKCRRSVKMDNADQLPDGTLILYTGKEDKEKNERLFGAGGDSGSIVYYKRRSDNAHVVVGYITHAYNLHDDKCSNKNCMSNPTSCLDEWHNECIPVCYNQTSKNYDVCPIYSQAKNNKLCNKGYNCHLHCNIKNCVAFKEEKSIMWTYVKVLPLSVPLSLLVRNLCKLNSGAEKEEKEGNLKGVQPVKIDYSGFKCTPYILKDDM